MPKYLLAAGLLITGLAACKKGEVIVNAKQAKPAYRVSGLSDMTVQTEGLSLPRRQIRQTAFWLTTPNSCRVVPPGNVSLN